MYALSQNSQIHSYLANGRTGDPCVYCFFPKTGESALFDLGSLENISHKDLLKVKYVFVSHAHVDHFIGFDRLLRVNIPHKRELHFVGPTDFSQRILSKLNSYTWNLIEDNQIRMYITELGQFGAIQRFFLHNQGDQFILTEENGSTSKNKDTKNLKRQPMEVLKIPQIGTVAAVPLDHGIDSLSFLLRCSNSTHVKIEVLEKLGLSAGPWIKELQKAHISNEFDKTMIIDQKSFDARQLAEQILEHNTGFSLAYTTDIIYSDENIQSLKIMNQNIDLYICETNYLKEEEQKAFEKKHLTTEHAALIAKACSTKKLEIFHISGLYGGNDSASLSEAEFFFNS